MTLAPLSCARLTLVAALALAACGDAEMIGAEDTSAAVGDVEVDVAEVVDTRDVAAIDTLEAEGPAWQVVLQDLPAALLSVSGEAPDDIWLTGADKGDGPLVIRGHGGVWARVDLRSADPGGGHLWWSVAPDASGRFLVGEDGRVFRWDSQADVVARVPTDTEATLYGVWGASSDEVWAVGGYVHPRSGPPTVLRVRGGHGEVVTDLPASLGVETTLFKVWGTAADDVWVVGEAGTVLHWDGAGWTHDVLPGAPRLVTLHGAGAGDMVAVGGSSQALIFERSGGAWRDASPGPYSLLNGVFVAPGGDALAVGVLGQTFHRHDGAWASDVDLPLNRDWHAAWIDGRGDSWIVGGRLLSAATFDAGTVLRLGPARSDLPGGDVVPLDPIAPADEDAADVVEAPGDIAEPVLEVVEDTSTVEDTDDGDLASDTGPLDTDGGPEETTPVDAEVTEEGDTADVDDASDASAPDPMMVLGALTGATDFTALTHGDLIEIVQGPQGGIHLEIAVRFPWAGVTAPTSAIAHCDQANEVQHALSSCGQCPCTAVTALDLRSHVDGVDVGAYATAGYPVSLLSPGVYQTYAVPVIFYAVDPEPFVGNSVEVRVTITLPDGEQRSTAVTLEMQDDF